MSLKPWREVAVPHDDVLRGTFQQAEFAADLSRVHAGTAAAEYQDAALFFQRTFITEGMRLLLDSVVRRLAGQGGDPVIQLQTAFGGGKTHTMMAVYHLAKGAVPSSDLLGVSGILDAAGVTDLPAARVAVLDGIKASPNQPIVREGQSIRTLWGDLAWQLGGQEVFALVADSDAAGTSPGKEILQSVLQRCAPCVILIDELVAYIRQFEEGKTLTGGTFDSNLSFVQALTEALKAVPTAVMLASLPESEKEAGSQRGVRALETLSHYFGRVQALWKPVEAEEAFEIVRRRLFTSINDKLAAESVCRAYADYYIANNGDFPQETQESRYFKRLQIAYPIHPEVFDRLYEDWSSLDNFQRTRGVLKLMAKVIHRLWNDNDQGALIMPSSLPLADAETRNELIYYLPAGWDPVLSSDIDGERAEATEIDGRDTRFGSIQACRRITRTIFLGSAPSTADQRVRGVELERVLLGSAQPGQQTGTYKDALRRLGDRLHYLNSGNNRYWFDTRPNLRREMEERKRRFHDLDDVIPAVREQIRRAIATGIFGGVHVFTESGDVPDDWQLRLVILSPDAGHRRSGTSQAQQHALEILKKRGDQPRFKQNRLIFLAADADNVSRLKDLVRSVLAWQSIDSDIKDQRLNLDLFQVRQVSESLSTARDTLRRMIHETWKWILAPVQTAVPGKGLSEIQWESFPINPGATNLSQEIERVLKDNELLITRWAPIHLAKMLRSWFWDEKTLAVSAVNVWQQSCQQLYLPRLLNDQVFQETLSAGAGSRDFFGFAQGRDGDRYLGFTFGQVTTPFLDDSLLLLEPGEAGRYAESLIDTTRPTTEQPQIGGGAGPSGGTEPTAPGGDGAGGSTWPNHPVSEPEVKQYQFYGNLALNPIQATRQFSEIMQEVVQHFTSRTGVEVKITVDIHANAPGGFDQALQRTVKENCNTLGFSNADFNDME